jgi:hypothetical protein
MEVIMFEKVLSKSAVLVLGVAFVVSLGIGLTGANAQDADCNLFGCDNDCEFTMDFRLEDCKFKTRGVNPFFILKPGYQLVLESEDEKSIETVLCDKKKIKLDGRKIKTRVVEERALELDGEEWVTVEISRNYFAICKKTNAVYYFGEDSQDCDLEETGGFNPNDESRCADGSTPDPAGSWEAGVDGARPGLIMPGTPLIGAKYFQEIAPPDAVDRGEILDVGLDLEVLGKSLSGCIEIGDTNPSEGVCDPEEDVKLYCPGVGLVADQELQLVERGFVGCDGDDDDDDDDDDHDKRWWWGRR